MMDLSNDSNLEQYDVCECGDYRKQHRDSRFECSYSDCCYVFRIFKQAVHLGVQH